MATKLVVGLGNPDKEYEKTRHNIGFQFLDYLAKKADAGDFNFEKKFSASTAKGKIKKTALVFAKPQTYVNKSGEAVAKIKNSLKLKPEAVILIHDDLDIPFGKFKISLGKNSGGHKGVESTMKSIKSKDFYRVRIGISTNALKKARSQSDEKRDTFVRDFVLSKFTGKEDETISLMFKDILKRLEELL